MGGLSENTYLGVLPPNFPTVGFCFFSIDKVTKCCMPFQNFQHCFFLAHKTSDFAKLDTFQTRVENSTAKLNHMFDKPAATGALATLDQFKFSQSF